MAEELDTTGDAELDQELAAATAVDTEPEVREPESPVQQGSLAALMRANGWDVDPTTTDEEAAAYIREKESAAERVADLESRLREVEAIRLHQEQQSQQPRKVDEPVPEPAKPKREVPEWDPEWESLLKLDDNGNVVTIASWVDPSIPGKYQKALKWQKAEQARMLREPGAVLRDTGYEDELKSRLLTPYEQRLAAIEEQIKQQTTQRVMSDRDRFLLNNSHFYAELDAEGNPLRDAQGLLVPNANYQRFVDIEAELERAGITDPAKRFELAAKSVPPTPATAPAPVAAVTPEVKRAKVRNRVAGKINGKTLAQPPVSRAKGGATELVERPQSIGQMKNRWLGMLEQAVGGDE